MIKAILISFLFVTVKAQNFKYCTDVTTLDVLWPNWENPTTFIQCTSFATYFVMNCPSILIFDFCSQRCEWPNIAQIPPPNELDLSCVQRTTIFVNSSTTIGLVTDPVTLPSTSTTINLITDPVTISRTTQTSSDATTQSSTDETSTSSQTNTDETSTQSITGDQTTSIPDEITPPPVGTPEPSTTLGTPPTPMPTGPTSSTTYKPAPTNIPDPTTTYSETTSQSSTTLSDDTTLSSDYSTTTVTEISSTPIYTGPTIPTLPPTPSPTTKIMEELSDSEILPISIVHMLKRFRNIF